MFVTLSEYLRFSLPAQVNVVYWSLTVEWHFYLLVPLLAWLMLRVGSWPMLAACLFLSFMWWAHTPPMQLPRSFVFGHLDQFVAGRDRRRARGRARGGGALVDRAVARRPAFGAAVVLGMVTLGTYHGSTTRREPQQRLRPAAAPAVRSAGRGVDPAPAHVDAAPLARAPLAARPRAHQLQPVPLALPDPAPRHPVGDALRAGARRRVEAAGDRRVRGAVGRGRGAFVPRRRAAVRGEETELEGIGPRGRAGARPPNRRGHAEPRQYTAPVAVPKIVGIETEYGVALRGAPDPNPVIASSLLINGYVEQHRVGWDFEDESPGRDARGFARDGSQPPEVETHLVNAVLTNGARYYVDHAHPEYSTPECSDPMQVVLFDKAGERILARSMDAARQLLPAGPGDRRLQEQQRRQGQLVRLSRELPRRPRGAVRDARAQPHPVVRHAAGVHRRGQGRFRERRRGGRLPDQPARRLLRGGGRARDDAEAPDRQHARRAARRPAEVPPAARDRRRREPVRGRDVPEGRHDRRSCSR